MRNWRQRFDPDAEYIFRRPVRLYTETLMPGADVPPGIAPGTLHRLWDRGKIELKHWPAPRSGPDPESAETDPEAEAIRAALIVQAIDVLDPEAREHWTGTGKPHTLALSGAVGFDVTSAERDVAWRTYQSATVG